MALRFNDEIPEHLDRLRIDERHMLLHNHRLHEELMENLPALSPTLIVVEQQHMVVLRDDGIPDIRRWAIAVNGRFLVHQLLNQTRRCDYYRSSRSKFKRKDFPVLPCPFGEPRAMVSSGKMRVNTCLTSGEFFWSGSGAGSPRLGE